ncbi:MAG: DNA topoisomerase I, partial [Nanoarchaeota archaeon]|nr:DNA topoisomerase I [Nanoarchaeota archaeon]
MAYELIITEKPKAAEKIASALAHGKMIKESYKKVPYYKITRGKKDIVVCCAVGHLYGLAEKDKKGWVYPVFDIEWVPSFEQNNGAKFTRKYVDAIRKVSKEADSFTVACDYDVEGELIGFNVLRFICKQKDAQRMKFSTLTKQDLINAYEKKSKTIDHGLASAGETRHELDWYYG